MSQLQLSKGQNLNLTKESSVTKFTIGLGWVINNKSNFNFDVDAIAFGLNKDKKMDGLEKVVYFRQRDILNGISLSADNLEGNPVAGEDCETIQVDVSQIDPDIHFINIMACIYEAKERGQNFGQISDCFVRIFETDTKKEMAKFDLTEDASGFNSFWLGTLYRYNNEWKFKATGEGMNGDINDHVLSFVN